MSFFPAQGRLRATSWTAIAGAVLLLVAGSLTALYEEHLYQAQRASQTREQAEILAASVTAALSFNDRKAAEEYVEPMQVNPEIEAAGVYGLDGALLAGFSRKDAPALPLSVGAKNALNFDKGRGVAVPVAQRNTALGYVYVRAGAEPMANRLSRFGVLLLLAVMGVLVIAGLGSAQVRLQRQARRLADANARLQSEMSERAKAEEALRQSQKMEAMGHLSGGIAHDFNNLLMIINGNLRLLQRRLALPDSDRHIASAFEGIRRAAALTQRILSFSRKQALMPTAVQLNDLIGGMGDLIRSSLRENVEFETDLRATRAVILDRNQMENVILNLAVNARDAMPEGGKFCLYTEDAPMECETGGEAGDGVKLTVCDTGIGMTEDVRARALDPFYTTKPIGQGTGLGLSTTYGFISQSRGRMTIDSAPGQGTTISILLPSPGAPDAANDTKGA
ncbi:MAG TPA: ATP-binding protein [Rhizomicrobium sp.]